MFSPQSFYEILLQEHISMFTGVPDSLLKDFCAYIKDIAPPEKNIIAVNEGSALALAAGYYLATKKPALVYLQNSGLGNLVNPLMSLTDEKVYNIPALLLIGWRGEPNVNDEPQHKKQGLKTLSLLETLDIKYEILYKDQTFENISVILKKATLYMREYKKPFALVVRKSFFLPYSLINKSLIYEPENLSLTREKAIQILIDNLNEKDIIISTTGMASRELFEYRNYKKQSHRQDFLTVGSMGHASQIALGIVLAQKKYSVYCIDGDGALLMHMGAMGTIGTYAPPNFKHIVLNNGAHDSVGGQATVGFKVSFTNIARACAYKKVYSISTEDDLCKIMNDFITCSGPSLLEIKIKKGARKDLGRPSTTPIENKEAFMNFLQS